MIRVEGFADEVRAAYLIVLLTVTSFACGGGGSSETQQSSLASPGSSMTATPHLGCRLPNRYSHKL